MAPWYAKGGEVGRRDGKGQPRAEMGTGTRCWAGGNDHSCSSSLPLESTSGGAGGTGCLEYGPMGGGSEPNPFQM